LPDFHSKSKKIGDIQGYLSRQLLKQQSNWQEYDKVSTQARQDLSQEDQIALNLLRMQDEEKNTIYHTEKLAKINEKIALENK
jgi:hypothetical protein